MVFNLLKTLNVFLISFSFTTKMIAISTILILIRYICTVSLYKKKLIKLEIITASLCMNHVLSIILIERSAYEKGASESLKRYVCFYALSNLFIAS